jgi:cytochrome c oxidase subunit 2
MAAGAPQAAAPTAPSAPAANATGAAAPAAPAPTVAQVAQAGFIAFPRDKMPAYTVPQTPLPSGLRYDDNLLAAGNMARGDSLVTRGACIACHSVRGEPMMVGVIGPNLTHLASRTTIAGGIYPNDAQHLARWVKNANAMKPGVTMPTFGLGEYDPVTIKGPVKLGGFTDQQIADIVAYLQSLK